MQAPSSEGSSNGSLGQIRAAISVPLTLAVTVGTPRPPKPEFVDRVPLATWWRTAQPRSFQAFRLTLETTSPVSIRPPPAFTRSRSSRAGRCRRSAWARPPRRLASRSWSKVAKTAGAQGLSGTDLAKQVAHYKAGQKQVGTLENQRGTTQQNEQTALLNGQQFIDRSTELPGQTQLPIINSLVQTAQRNLPVPGHETIAAMDAAWNTFVNEYAKVVSGTPSGGGTLSDSARHEAMQTMQGNYSLSQKQAAFAQMKADMANRLTAMNGTIDQAYENITVQPGHRNDAAIAGLPGNPAPTDNGITPSNPPPAIGPSGPAGSTLSGSQKAVADPNLAKIAPQLEQYLAADPKKISNAMILGYMKKNGVNPTNTSIGAALQYRMSPDGAAWRKRGGNYGVDPTYNVPLGGMDKARAELGASPGGALAIHAGNAATAGLVGPLTGTTDTMNTALAATSATNPTASLLGDVGGSALPMMGAEAALHGAGMAPGLLRSALANAGYGAVAGGAQDGSAGAGMGALVGAAGGVAGEKLAGGLGAALKGVTNPSVGYVAKDVPLTLGQAVGQSGIVGRAVKGVEDRLAGLPVVGDAINARRLEGLQKMNSAAFDRALEPIGAKAGGKFGEQAVADAQDQVSAAFTKALQGKTADLDRGFIVDATKAKMGIDKLPDSVRDEVNNQVDHAINNYFDDGGQITGENMQALLRELGGIKRGYQGSPLGHRIGTVVDQFSDSVENLFRRQSPDVMPQYDAAKKAFKRVSTLEGAVLRAKNTNGVFTPGQLGMEDRANTVKFGGKHQAAAGGGGFHDFQRAMQETLPNKVPDSGTAGRPSPRSRQAAGNACSPEGRVRLRDRRACPAMHQRHPAEAEVMPSAACFALIRKSEGLRLKAYQDCVGVLDDRLRPYRA
jgi:hypothetical protein